MPRLELRLPVPPLELGVSWTGVSLLNWVLDNSDPEMAQALTVLRDSVGGDQFSVLWNGKADELNRRLASRVLDARGLPADPDEGSIKTDTLYGLTPPGVN